MRKNHKSILGLNTVKAFIVVLLALAIIGIVTLVIMGLLGQESMIAQVGPIVAGAAVNESVTPTTGGTAMAYNTQNSPVCAAITSVYNATSSSINSGNYTQTNCVLANTTGTFAGAWKVSYTWQYRDRAPILGVTQNVSGGVNSFFGNAGTFFALLGVVVIILIISLVVVVVNRFGGSSGGASGQNPSL